MKTTLKQNLSNAFYLNRNVLTAKPNRVSVIVEDYEDVAFWAHVLQSIRPDKQFDIRPYQEGGNHSQSKQLIVKTIRDKGGSVYIGCVDSDQDKILEGNRYPGTGLFFPANYLFHTYSYSIESLYCMPSTLNLAYTTISSFQCDFDFDGFFRALSQTVFELFVTDLYLRSKGSRTVFNVDDWKNVFPGGGKIKKALKNGEVSSILEDLKKGINKYLKKLTKSSDYSSKECSVFEERMIADNSYITKENCCLFIYGHGFLDFVVNLIGELQQKDLNDAVNSIRSDSSMQPKVRVEKENHLKNLQKDISTILHANYEFMHSGIGLYERIVADLQKIL